MRRVAHREKFPRARAGGGVGARRVRTVEGHAGGTPTEAVEVVKALPAPVVVGLPRVDRALDQDRRAVRRAAGVIRLPHDERDEGLLPVPRPREAGQIDPAHPVRRDRHAAGNRPVAFDEAVLGARLGDGSLPARHAPKLEDLPSPRAAIPAHPEHLDGVARREGADVEPQGLPRLHARRLGVSFDFVGQCGILKLPPRAPGALVFKGDGARGGLRGARRKPNGERGPDGAESP